MMNIKLNIEIGIVRKEGNRVGVIIRITKRRSEKNI